MMALRQAKAEHQAVLDELTAILKKHTKDLDAAEVLAVAANMVGKIIALQDQRTMTPRRAMEIVIKNIEHGNAEAFRHLSESRGSA